MAETPVSPVSSAALPGGSPTSPPAAAVSAIRRVPPPLNEPVKAYAPGSPERAEIKARLHSIAAERIEIPLIIGGKEVRSGDLAQAVMPHDHRHVLADWHKARPEHVEQAIAAALEARREWASWPWEDRAAVLLKAAELLTTSWRSTLNATTMLGQSKTVFQAEIDSACELIDFWRFNPQFAQELYADQPVCDHTMWNQIDYRALEGFVYAVSPFNFTSIGGNLTTAPALMGNVVIWKPASTGVLSSYCIVKLLEAAGMPPGVINFLPGNAAAVSEVVLSHPELAGIHFTGSTEVFQSMWRTVGQNVARYRGYPRLVGETGGKDFIVAHASADPQALAVAVARGGYEYQGQKCSAVSRIYVPQSLWRDVSERIAAMLREFRLGDPRDFRNFMGAVIDKKSFDNIAAYLDDARRNARIVTGGGCSAERGYFVEPTLVEAPEPGYRLMCEEIFGPVVTACVYPDAQWLETLAIVDRTSPYALTGAVFAQDRRAVREATGALRNAAGNFYVNDKPTGAVVGQQPFGGARASGTNDKAGSKLNLVRWTSARAIKENLAPPYDFRYPFMAEE